MMLTVPDYLYHYTNISSLALILKNKSIKLSPLHLVDDLEEASIKDPQNFAKYCFVSSWTDDNKESIPMWKMYTKEIDGVRIKMPSNPFRTYKISWNDIVKILPAGFSANGEIVNSRIPYTDLLNNVIVPSTSNVNVLHKVEYTDDPEKLCPMLTDQNKESFDIRLGLLGRYKRISWSFQNEWRYILNIYPISFSEIISSIKDSSYMVNKMLKCPDLPLKEYFLFFNDEKLKDFEITLSPKISSGNEEIVRILVEKYNSGAIIKDSILKGKLR